MTDVFYIFVDWRLLLLLWRGVLLDLHIYLLSETKRLLLARGKTKMFVRPFPLLRCRFASQLPVSVLFRSSNKPLNTGTLALSQKFANYPRFYSSAPQTSKKDDDDSSESLSPFGNIIQEEIKKYEETVVLPNTRGEYREQVCRTPMMKVSTKRLNMIGHLIKGLDVEDAMLQLMFLKRDHCEEVLWAIQEGCKIAKEIQKVDPRSLYVAWAYVCRGVYTKKIDIKGRGRSGRIRSPESHMVLLLRDKAARAVEEQKKRESKQRRYEKNPLFRSRVINARIPL